MSEDHRVQVIVSGQNRSQDSNMGNINDLIVEKFSIAMNKRVLVWLSLLDGISTFARNLMPKPSFLKDIRAII